MFILTNHIVMFGCEKTMKIGIVQLDMVFNSFDGVMIVRELAFTIKEWVI